ncbi:tail fiber domain-containing protein [Chitinophaga sp. NPDC101104]|uniref:tail fiber domain-containing protein n=1 Tax=Chitinophaga sp. NPDC101104 TaxID=3390561 RepID=UPI003CFDA9DA
MRIPIILFIVSFFGLLPVARAQHVYQIRADSVRIYNVCDTAELIIENRTRGVSGYLYNKSNGRTEFRKIDLVQIGGSKLAIAGQDTIDLSQMSGVGGIDTIYRVGDNIRFVKRGIATEIFAPLAPPDSVLKLQGVTGKGNTTTHDIIFNNPAGNPSNGLQWGYNTDTWRIHVESPQDTPSGNMIFESNDNGDEGWIFRSKSPGMATDVLTMNRTRSVLRGNLVHLPTAVNPENNTINLLWNAMGGANVSEDPEFRRGNNGLAVYNNISGSNAVTITRTNDVLTEKVPNTSGYYLRITTTDPTEATVSPALGGVMLQYPTKENTVYVTRFRALIPVGYQIFANHNLFGANSSSVWLTSTAGTGKWEDYIQLYVSGSSAAGSAFSTIAYYSLVGPLQTTTWYLGYYDFKVSSGSSWAENIPQNLTTGRPTKLYLEDDSTRLTKGAQHSLRITTPFGYLDAGPQNTTHMHFATDRQNFVFTKPVVATDKLAIYNNGPVTSSTTYLTQTEGRINNSPILTEASASGAYIMKQVDSSQTGNLWLKGTLKTDASLITKLANGNASIRIHNSADVLRFGIGLNNNETGADAGGDLHIWRYSDAGNNPKYAMTMNRATGHIWMPGRVSAGNSSRVMGDRGGNDFLSWFGFYDSTNTRRYGYVGKGTLNAVDMQISSDSGNVHILPKGGNFLNVGNVELSYNGGTFAMKHGAANNILFPAQGVGAPVVNTRSIGTRIILSPSYGPTTVDYAIGMETNNIWFSTSTAGTGFKWYAGSTNVASLTGTGNLTLSGTATATAFYQSSLRSLKKDIRPFSASALDVLGKAPVRSFIFKTDSTGYRNIGFIADEVPDEIATPTRNGVNQANVVGLLVKAIQELKADKDAMEARMTAEKAEMEMKMKLRYNELEARLKAIEELLQTNAKK